MPEPAKTADPNDATLTDEGLDAALKDLAKSIDTKATADKLTKGGQVYSGVSDERGKVSGGSNPDAGKLDSLMIGKAIGQLVNDGVLMPGPNMAAFAANGYGEDEGSEDEEEDKKEMKGAFSAIQGELKGLADAGFFDKSEPNGDMCKGFLEDVASDDDVRQAIDASPFMERLVESTANSIGVLEKSFHQSEQLSKATARVVNEMAKSFKALNERLHIVESTPLPAKGESSLTGAQAMVKSLSGEPEGKGKPQLQKSHLLSIMTHMNLVKGIKQIGGRKSVETIGKLDSTNQISPEAMADVRDYVESLPDTERRRVINFQG